MPTTVAVRVQGEVASEGSRCGVASEGPRCDAVRRLESGAQRTLGSNSHQTSRKFQKPPKWGLLKFVASEGFEPPKAEPSDLQSDPFGR